MTPVRRTASAARKPLLGAVCAALAIAVSACGGSALAPLDVAAANAAAGAAAPGSAPAGSDGDLAGSGGLPLIVDPPGDRDPDDPRSPAQLRDPGAGSSGQHHDGPPGGGSGTSPTGTGVRPGSCAGFANTTGISEDAITIGTVADISGPVPGIYSAATNAVKAYAAYVNATSTICGRRLEVKVYDSQTTPSGDQYATQKACDETFAAVGSMSAFDTGGAATADRCGIPEIHAIIANPARAACASCFAAQAPQGGYFPSAIPDYFTGADRAATQKAAMLYVNAAAAVSGAKGQIRSEERRGWKFVYTAGFDIAEFNYGPLVQRLKSSDARIVQLFGSPDMAVRMARTFQQANYRPEIYLLNATQYDRSYVGAGSAVEGSVVFTDFTPIEEAAVNPELRRYTEWLQQVNPGAQPTYYGLYAWSAARLFVEEVTRLGGKLTRASLVARLRTVQDWTGNGLHAPQPVGGKVSGRCIRFLQVRDGAWVPYGGTKYRCGGLSSAS